MNKQQKIMERELSRLYKQERSFLEKRMEKKDSALNRLLAEKVPEKLQGTLDAAFAKAFALVFEKGTAVIEKSVNREEKEKQLLEDFEKFRREELNKKVMQYYGTEFITKQFENQTLENFIINKTNQNTKYVAERFIK